MEWWGGGQSFLFVSIWECHTSKGYLSGYQKKVKSKSPIYLSQVKEKEMMMTLTRQHVVKEELRGGQQCMNGVNIGWNEKDAREGGRLDHAGA